MDEPVRMFAIQPLQTTFAYVYFDEDFEPVRYKPDNVS